MRRFVYYFAASTAIILALPTAMKAQSAEPFNYYNNISPSIEPFAMERYGNVEHSLYTGAMTYSLPLYTYQDEDFTLPISLDYHYDGFRPAQHSGSVGYGWALNCGGLITREVRGIPDEQCIMEDRIDGYFLYIRDSLHRSQGTWGIVNDKYCSPSFPLYSFDEHIGINLLNDQPVHADTVSLSTFGSNMFDSSPDIFHFSLPGYSGSFIINDNGEFIVFNTNRAPGEISVSMDYTPTVYVTLTFYSFKIKTGNGYEYVFGGDKSTSGYFYNYSNGEVSYTLTEWRLCEIKAPNGRRLTLHYDKDHNIEESITSTISPDITLSSISAGIIQGGAQVAQRGYNICRRYTSRITSIIINNRRIEFNYSDKEYEEGFSWERNQDRSIADTFISQDLKNDDDTQKALSSISVISNDGTVTCIFLDYDYLGGSGLRRKMFLSSVRNTMNGTHSFEYCQKGYPLPDNDTYCTDHWGYHTSTGDNTFRGRFKNNNGSLYNQFVRIGDKNRDDDYTNQYGLVKIVYPTGGYTEIEYEPNDASQLLDRYLGSHPFLRDNTGFFPGGVRVRKLTNKTAEHSDSTLFYYVSDYGLETQKSSGIVLHMPRYSVLLDYNYTCDHSDSEYGWIRGAVYTGQEIGYTLEGSFDNASQNVIGYSNVTLIHSDGSRTDYEFYDYEEYPDLFSGSNDVGWIKKTYRSWNDWIDIPSIGYDISIAKMIMPPSEDRTSIRGRLKARREYTGNRIIETEYNYAIDNKIGTASMVLNGLLCFMRIDYICNQIYLISETTQEIENGRTLLQSEKTYSYNSLGQKTAETILDGEGRGNSIIYKYCHETGSEYLLSQICDIIQIHVSDEEMYLIASTHLGYSNLINPSASTIQSYKIEKPILVSNQSFFSCGRSNGYRQTDITYNNMFRPTEVSSPGGEWVRYTWDSDGINLLTREESVPGYKYLYQWKDLVGLTDVTAPSRETTSYTYDARNRLATEWDTRGNPLYHFFYKLKNE